MALSINQIKHIKALSIKKYRDQHGEFIAEGAIIVNHLMASNFEIVKILALPQWLDLNEKIILEKKLNCFEINEIELKKISNVTSPNQVLAIVKKPVFSFDKEIVETELVLLLDEINNPGNLGTIIRIADWFGIKHIVCTTNCVDLYNPKTIQAAMGSVINVQVHYIDVLSVLAACKADIPIYGALLDGISIYNETLTNNGIIVIGNEANGISNEIRAFINKKIMIPSFATSQNGAESLNASIATGIILSEFKRRDNL